MDLYLTRWYPEARCTFETAIGAVGLDARWHRLLVAKEHRFCRAQRAEIALLASGRLI
jgi:hypothetical protein